MNRPSNVDIIRAVAHDRPIVATVIALATAAVAIYAGSPFGSLLAVLFG